MMEEDVAKRRAIGLPNSDQTRDYPNSGTPGGVG